MTDGTCRWGVHSTQPGLHGGSRPPGGGNGWWNGQVRVRPQGPHRYSRPPGLLHHWDEFVSSAAFVVCSQPFITSLIMLVWVRLPSSTYHLVSNCCVKWAIDHFSHCSLPLAGSSSTSLFASANQHHLHCLFSPVGPACFPASIFTSSSSVFQSASSVLTSHSSRGHLTINTLWQGGTGLLILPNTRHCFTTSTFSCYGFHLLELLPMWK